MYSKICTMYDKLNAVYFIVSTNETNTIFELKRFTDIKEAIFYYDENKDRLRIPYISELKRLGVFNGEDSD